MSQIGITLSIWGSRDPDADPHRRFDERRNANVGVASTDAPPKNPDQSKNSSANPNPKKKKASKTD